MVMCEDHQAPLAEALGQRGVPPAVLPYSMGHKQEASGKEQRSHSYTYEARACGHTCIHINAQSGQMLLCT